MASYSVGMAVEPQHNRVDITANGSFTFTITSPGSGGYFKFYYHGWAAQTSSSVLSSLTVYEEYWHNPSGQWMIKNTYAMVGSPTLLTSGQLQGLSFSPSLPVLNDQNANFLLIGNSPSDGARLRFQGSVVLGGDKATFTYSLLRYY